MLYGSECISDVEKECVSFTDNDFFVPLQTFVPCFNKHIFINANYEI